MDFYRASWRKTTDINREYAVFELVHDNTVLLDIGFTDNDVLEIAFHEAVSSTVIDWDRFLQFINKGKKLAEDDK